VNNPWIYLTNQKLRSWRRKWSSPALSACFLQDISRDFEDVTVCSSSRYKDKLKYIITTQKRTTEETRSIPFIIDPSRAWKKNPEKWVPKGDSTKRGLGTASVHTINFACFVLLQKSLPKVWLCSRKILHLLSTAIPTRSWVLWVETALEYSQKFNKSFKIEEEHQVWQHPRYYWRSPPSLRGKVIFSSLFPLQYFCILLLSSVWFILLFHHHNKQKKSLMKKTFC
jgi:hypothetical protein